MKKYNYVFCGGVDRYINQGGSMTTFQEHVANTLQSQALGINEWRVDNGFYTPSSVLAVATAKTQELGEADAMLGKLMLVVTEIAEAAEELHLKNQAGLGEELADTAIRILDILATVGLNVEAVFNASDLEQSGEFHGSLIQLLIYVSRAAEAVRDENLELFGKHLGDALMGIHLFCEHHELSLTKEIALKMEVNKQRPFKHGRKTSL